MKKVIKWFSIFAVIGTAIGLVIAYFCKNNSENSGENGSGHTEEEDFDLDADLKPASEREYVSLSKDPILKVQTNRMLRKKMPEKKNRKAQKKKHLTSRRKLHQKSQKKNKHQ